MKLLTLNLNNYMEADRYGKLEQIAFTIIEKDIDVICLQEVGQYYLEYEIIDGIKAGNLALALKNILLKQFKVNYSIEIKITGLCEDRYEEGIAILSKEPLVNTDTIDLSEIDKIGEQHDRQVLYGEYQGYNIVCANFSEHEFYPLFTKLISKLEMDEQTVIAGDLGIKYMSENYRTMIEYGLVDAVAHANSSLCDYPTHRVKMERVDYIMTNFGECVSAEKYFFEDDYQVSDHIGVMLEF